MGAVHGHPGAAHRSRGSENSWARVGSLSQQEPVGHIQATAWYERGNRKNVGKCYGEKDLVNDFYNENHMINPFGNLIDYRVYLSMWVLKK